MVYRLLRFRLEGEKPLSCQDTIDNALGEGFKLPLPVAHTNILAILRFVANADNEDDSGIVSFSLASYKLFLIVHLSKRLSMSYISTFVPRLDPMTLRLVKGFYTNVSEDTASSSLEAINNQLASLEYDRSADMVVDADPGRLDSWRESVLLYIKQITGTDDPHSAEEKLRASDDRFMRWSLEHIKTEFTL